MNIIVKILGLLLVTVGVLSVLGVIISAQENLENSLSVVLGGGLFMALGMTILIVNKRA